MGKVGWQNGREARVETLPLRSTHLIPCDNSTIPEDNLCEAFSVCSLPMSRVRSDHLVLWESIVTHSSRDTTIHSSSLSLSHMLQVTDYTYSLREE